jgi:hypothetical protein
MTAKQKIALSIGSGLLAAYAVIFVYQRIQRAKADKSVVSEGEALDEVVSNTPSDDLKQFEIETGYGDY